MDVLEKIRPFLCISPSIFPLCRMGAESGNHIFIHCGFTSKVSNFFKDGHNLYFVMPESVDSLFRMWGRGAKGKQGKMFLKVILPGVF